MALHENDTTSPSEFHSVYDFSEENSIMSPKGSPPESNFISSGWSSYSSLSDFSSTFGSEMGSTETESEDDDFIAELRQLTRRMAEYTFQDDGEEYQKASSAEATASQDSDKGSGLSAKCPQGNSSPMYYCDNGFMAAYEKSSADSGLAKRINSSTCSDQVICDERMRPLQVYELKNQPQIRKQSSEHGGGKRVRGSEHKGHHNVHSKQGKAWRNSHRKKMTPLPHLPVSPQAGSGMRAVFLGGSNARTGSCGTGVFLPSSSYSAAEPKSKSGCSTVLIPARVLQTLQQHFNNVGVQSQSTSSGGIPNRRWQNDVLTRINGLLSQKMEHVEFQTWQATNHDKQEEEAVQLPQEWTY